MPARRRGTFPLLIISSSETTTAQAGRSRGDTTNACMRTAQLVRERCVLWDWRRSLSLSLLLLLLSEVSVEVR